MANPASQGAQEVWAQQDLPISISTQPLPTGASTEATLLLIKAKTDNLDVLLSTRTKPLDTQKVDGSAVTQPVSGTFWQATQPVSGTFWQTTQPISVASLPLPANAAQETGGNLATVKTNTDPFVTAAAGGYVRQDSTATIAKETGGNLATLASKDFSTEATLAKLTQTQGSATSGQSGPLVQAAVNVSDPSYTDLQTSPLSVTSGGRLRVDTEGTNRDLDGLTAIYTVDRFARRLQEILVLEAYEQGIRNLFLADSETSHRMGFEVR